MQCPVCRNVSLMMAERQGVEIDYCPQCRGIWLDRGELDKILERSSDHGYARNSSHEPKPASSAQSYFHKEEKGHIKGSYPKKKEGFLSELFDF